MTASIPIVLVTPHPDDEGQALSVLEDPRRLVAIVTLTLGEATRRVPPHANGRSIADSRIDSWHAFLDATLDGKAPRADHLLQGRAWRGSGTTRYAMDGGDGLLSAPAAMGLVMSVLDDLAPARPVDLVLCAYDADDHRHADHVALAASGPELTTDARVRRVLVRAVNGRLLLEAGREFHRRSMGPGGAFQSAYGWLAPNRTSWPSSEQSGLFPRISRFDEFGPL